MVKGTLFLESSVVSHPCSALSMTLLFILRRTVPCTGVKGIGCHLAAQNYQRNMPHASHEGFTSDQGQNFLPKNSLPTISNGLSMH